ncbi:F0F1 ATP synthase subunit B [Clostridium gasigenes]|uniref:F0F1 ATP synthase subunit B n=1 Tax=Clostridium gasigenes TaxID=94869 RepID=UPI0014385972|nr:F0F1 ATP synthase subunit B [Clostridium gasigenes]NKF06397.1 F0F1 ATP synthase subunit B [Clostridium gasigenes]QSW21375.1 F0F1 ATP synthase subunit B [Clostridium gasigenes]
MELNPSIVIATIINFIGLLAILKYFFFDKVKAIIDEREALINEQLDNAEEEQEKSRMLAIENERMLKSAREEGKKITEREKQKAESIYEEIIGEAHTEAKIILERAKIEINREKEKAEYELKKQAITLAIEISKKVIEKNIDEEKNRELIDNFISKVGS